MEICLSKLDWHRDNPEGEGELSIDASTLRLAPGDVPKVVAVTSSRTGKVRTFLLAGTLVSRDDDVLAWSYWDDESPAINLKIFND